MCNMTLLSHLKYIQYLTLKGNSVSHNDQFDMSHDPIEPLKRQFSISHLKTIQYLTLKGNSVSQTDQFDMPHDPIEPLKIYSVSHT
jgi:hypothetical protein